MLLVLGLIYGGGSVCYGRLDKASGYEGGVAQGLESGSRRMARGGR